MSLKENSGKYAYVRLSGAEIKTYLNLFRSNRQQKNINDCSSLNSHSVLQVGGSLKIHTREVCTFIACAREKRERRAGYNMWRLRQVTDADMNQHCGRGMVSRLPGNMCERTMRCNVQRKTFFRERMERYARRNDSEREEKGTGSVAGKRCALKFSKMAAVRIRIWNAQAKTAPFLCIMDLFIN